MLSGDSTQNIRLALEHWFTISVMNGGTSDIISVTEQTGELTHPSIWFPVMLIPIGQYLSLMVLNVLIFESLSL